LTDDTDPPDASPLDASPLDFVQGSRPVSVQLVAGRGHYDAVVQATMTAERSVWIATANLKELMVEDARARPGARRSLKVAGRRGGRYRSILAVFDELAGRGVELRILHASPPSRPFRAELRRWPRLAHALVLHACPRVHLKAVIVDGALVYLGSANWTGAGLGAKGQGRRNFELGILTRDDLLLDQIQAYYDSIWRGRPCASCRLRPECPGPLDGALARRKTARQVSPGEGR
jgi:phosphatidylserine/phosphatidylglycerophosphate/cardiolipin synthase-like enzyme